MSRSYFDIGAEALTRIERCLLEAGRADPRSVLDFPCGHGRVLRMLAARWPDAVLVAGDTDRAGVDFCTKEFAARALYSQDDLSHVDANGSFDLQFCGSLLTHFPADRWLPTLAFFRRHLAEGGLLVFTTHGEYSAQALAGEVLPRFARYGFAPANADRMVADYEQTGFGYSAYSGDDPGATYGHSVSSRTWVETRIRQAALRLEYFIEGGWGLHQDFYACSAA
jgi:SAM-dependent methyltransferase